jgi:hypothetical protein
LTFCMVTRISSSVNPQRRSWLTSTTRGFTRWILQRSISSWRIRWRNSGENADDEGTTSDDGESEKYKCNLRMVWRKKLTWNGFSMPLGKDWFHCFNRRDASSNRSDTMRQYTSWLINDVGTGWIENEIGICCRTWLMVFWCADGLVVCVHASNRLKRDLQEHSKQQNMMKWRYQTYIF